MYMKKLYRDQTTVIVITSRLLRPSRQIAVISGYTKGDLMSLLASIYSMKSNNIHQDIIICLSELSVRPVTAMQSPEQGTGHNRTSPE